MVVESASVVTNPKSAFTYSEGIPRIHRSSWGFVDAVLRRDLRYDHDLLVGWPRLHKILKANASVLSPSPNPEFLAALSSITWALVLSSIVSFLPQKITDCKTHSHSLTKIPFCLQPRQL